MPPVDPALLAHLPPGVERQDWETALAIGALLMRVGVDVSDLTPTRTRAAEYGKTGRKRKRKPKLPKPRKPRPKMPTRDERLAATLATIKGKTDPTEPHPPRDT
jgi:hypothetical protein